MNPFRIAAIFLFVSAACFAAAKPPFLKIFLATYKVDPNSDLGKARCLTCHLPPSPPKRNPYGLLVQKALEDAHGRIITPEMLKSIESKDADGDGFTNIQEIKAGTLPGNAQSKPKGKPKSKPKAKHKKGKSAMIDPQSAGGLAFFIVPALALGVVRRSRGNSDS